MEQKAVIKNEGIFRMWLKWQFLETPLFLMRAWNNYMDFAISFFSFKLLLKTFFSPWKKYSWRYPKVFDVQEFLNTLVSNTFSRILGAIMRIFLIITGALFQAFVAIAGLVALLCWLATPLIIIAGFIFIFLF